MPPGLSLVHHHLEIESFHIPLEVLKLQSQYQNDIKGQGHAHIGVMVLLKEFEYSSRFHWDEILRDHLQLVEYVEVK